MFGTIKNLIGFGGNPSNVDIAYALASHVKDGMDALEEVFTSAAEPSNVETIRENFRNGDLLLGLERLPIYVLFVAKGLCEKLGIEDHAHVEIAELAYETYSGKAVEQARAEIQSVHDRSFEIFSRYKEQIFDQPLVLDSETMVVNSAMGQYTKLANYIRKGQRKRPPIDADFISFMFMGLGGKDVTEHKLAETNPNFGLTR